MLKTARDPYMQKILNIAVRYLLPLALTVLLVTYMFKKVNFSEMWDLIKHGVDYWWIILAMVISVFSHVFRAARWRLQLDALGIRPPFMALCCSIFGCYALNLVFPRLGEVWRCTYIASSEKASFTSVLGSMIGDRLADTLMVLLLLLLCLVVAPPALEAFMTKYPVGRDLVALIGEWWFWAAIVGGVILVWVLLRVFRDTKVVEKLKGMALNMWEGFSVVARMKGRWQFLILTLCIWGCYFTQLYVAFYAFGFTRALCHEPGLAAGLTPCLVAFVLRLDRYGDTIQRWTWTVESRSHVRSRDIRHKRCGRHSLLHAPMERSDCHAYNPWHLHDGLYLIKEKRDKISCTHFPFLLSSCLESCAL